MDSLEREGPAVPSSGAHNPLIPLMIVNPHFRNRQLKNVHGIMERPGSLCYRQEAGSSLKRSVEGGVRPESRNQQEELSKQKKNEKFRELMNFSLDDELSKLNFMFNKSKKAAKSGKPKLNMKVHFVLPE